MGILDLASGVPKEGSLNEDEWRREEIRGDAEISCFE
jgi:hypothetical protein